jgi:hypothetical protein
MVIGVDFDNTIVCYDDLFHRIALERGWLPASVPAIKKEVRDYLRRQGREQDWTELQGYVYGPRMAEAQAFPGVLEFFARAVKHGLPIYIISHKTPKAAAGPEYDLRQSALDWLKLQGFFDPNRIGLPLDNVVFGATRQEKLELIRQRGCTVFVDDLAETFLEPDFPRHVERILFGCKAAPPELAGIAIAPNWTEVSHRLLNGSHVPAGGRLKPALHAENMREELAKMLGQPVTQIERIGGGRNSQVYRVRAASREVALKAYFRHAADKRDRMGTEFSSFSFLWENGFRQIPQPIKSDSGRGWAIYEFVEGEKLAPGQVSRKEILEAADFLAQLRELARQGKGRHLGVASEAFFAARFIAENLRERLAKLQAIEQNTESTRALQRFLEAEFAPFLTRAIAWSAAHLQAAGMDFDRELPPEQRTLSPSDFGFHNALRRADGRIIFLDFEYFGWDDSAKMMADFLLHPAMELPQDLKKTFAQAMFQRFADWPWLLARVESVYPLFGLKWCMIMLNEFLPAALQRREFAALAPPDRSELQLRQLDKARHMLQRIQTEFQAFPYRD